MSNASTLKVNLSDDHLRRVSRANPVQAIEELIWNSLDSDATEIFLRVESNELGNQSIIIEDNGSGISEKQASQYLGFIGNSWKAVRSETERGRPIHGQKGEGRFKAFSLGRIVDWESIFQKDNRFYELTIYLNSDRADEFRVSAATPSKANKTKTIIKVSELNKKVVAHNFDELKNKLTQTFSSYLYAYPDIKITVNGYLIDPREAIENISEYTLQLENIAGKHQVKIIEWLEISSKQLLLCKDNGTVLKEYKFQPNRVRNLGYSFSAYIVSDYITKLNSDSSLDFIDMDSDSKTLLDAAYHQINEHFKAKKSNERLLRLQRWKESGIYPFEENTDPGIIETAKREIFDIIASKVEDNLPTFANSNHKTKKFTFKLLSQSLENNPKSIQAIITEVLNLNTEEQNEFATLLEKTSLSHIIRSAKTVADRLDFLESLSTLVFDHKKSLLERDQLHKILESESWIFDEHFALAGSEKRLEEVLDIHIKLLGKRCEDDSPVLINNERQGRVDLMLSKSVEVRPGHKDFLIVELKRPTKKIDNDVIGQIMGYAQAVNNDERFHKANCKWKFIAISNQFDDIAEMRANNTGLPKGCVHQEKSIEIYIMKWSEVITNAKARLKFYQEQLSYEADSESSISYLHKIHNEFVPVEIRKQA